MGRLKDKVAIVTGGANGMGESHVRTFINEGAKVVIADLNIEDGEKLAEELGDNAIAIKLDVADYDNWEEVVEKTEEKFGPVNILVNNAGISGVTAKFSDVKIEDYKLVVDINQFGVFYGMKAVYPSMKNAENGSIVNISSTAGIKGEAMSFSYAASKFAVTGMTRAGSKDLGPEGIRVNSIHPGVVLTDFYGADAEASGAVVEAAVKTNPLGREGKIQEITNAVLFLASEESSYVNGAQIVVDGGMTA